MRRNLIPMLAIACTLALSGCGGGGGENGNGMVRPPDDGDRPPTGGGTPTPVVGVSIGNLANIDSIHLEMADAYVDWRARVAIGGPAPNPHAEGNPLVSESVRDEVVCPGVPPRGNECSAGPTVIIDGESEHGNLTPADYSIEFHARILEGMTNQRAFGEQRVLGERNGVPHFWGRFSDTFNHEMFGGWGQYFGMYTHRTNRELVEVHGMHTYAASFGLLYSGHPTAVQGSATWRGVMVGHQRADGLELEGDSRLEYDFGANTVDLTLSSIGATDRNGGQNYSGPNTFRWEDLRVNNDGSFYIRNYGNDRAGTELHPELGYVDGDFYGLKAEEFAGVFEAHGVVGAYGGKRQ